MKQYAEHENLIKRHLSDRKRHEALDWLNAIANRELRTIGENKTKSDSIRYVQKLYNLGAEEVIAVGIRKERGKNNYHTGKLVVKLPPDLGKRKALFGWCKQQGESLGFSPEKDSGESHLFLLLD